MAKPTGKELYNEEYESVYRESDDSWRHGAYVTEVFKSPVDETFWQASYELSTDGETHGLREGTAEIIQVKPVEKTVIIYEVV